MAKVNPLTRSNTANNHSATHLLHAALRKVLGHHVTQKGSLVDADRTRFDFSHNAPLTAEEIRETERLVNEQIRNNWLVESELMKYDDAIKRGAMALFGEKYGDVVRVVDMDWSKEFCGGTHVSNTKEIIDFAICSYESIGSGIYRMEGVTGSNLVEQVKDFMENLFHEIELITDKAHKLDEQG